MAGGTIRGLEQGEAVSEHDPREDYDDEPWNRRRSPQDIVRWPASIRWVFGVLQFIATQLWMALLISTTIVVEFVDGDQTLGEFWNSVKDEWGFWLYLGAWPVGTACAIIVMRAANDLKRFRRYTFVVAGAILTFLSVPCIFLGVVQVPLGVWLILLLLRRDVRARFEAVARAGRGVPIPIDASTRHV